MNDTVSNIAINHDLLTNDKNMMFSSIFDLIGATHDRITQPFVPMVTHSLRNFVKRGDIFLLESRNLFIYSIW